MAQRKNGSSDWAQLTCARQVAAAGRHLLTMLNGAIVSLLKEPAPVLDSEAIIRCADASEHFLQLIEAAFFDAPLAHSCTSHLRWLHDKLSRWIKDRQLSVNDSEDAIADLRDCANSLNGLVLAAEGVRWEAEKGAGPEVLTQEPESRVDFGTPEFNILVLGDMHLGAPDQVAAWDNMRFKFLDDLEYLEKRLQQKWDLVAFVGDMTYRGEQAEFDCVDAFVEELWKRWDAKGWAPKLVAVPGNHDLVRPSEWTSAVQVLLSFYQDPRVENKLFGPKKDKEFRPVVSACFENYNAWQERHRRRWPEGASCGSIPGDFTASIEGLTGKRLGIMGLNSAFLHLDDCAKRKSHLCVSEHQFHHAGGAEWCRNQDICLVLTHHPAEWLHKSNRDVFYRSIFSTDNFGLHVCGHLHEGKARSFSTQGLPHRELVINSSLFGRKVYRRKDKRIHGYSAVQLLTKESKWYYRLWPRRANENLQWKLIIDWDFVIDYPSEGTAPCELPTRGSP